MAAIESNITTHALGFPASVKGCDPDGVFATTANEKKVLAERWNAITDKLSVWLIEWGQNPSFTDEDGLVFPSGVSCSSACKLVIYMKDRSWPLPTGVIPDGEGGIVIENKQGSSYQCFEIDEDGLIRLSTFRNCKLLSQHNVEL